MKKILFLLIITICVPMTMYAQVESNTWKAEFSAGFTNYSAWEVEPAVSYHFLPCLGVRFGVLATDLNDKNYLTGESIDGKYWWVTKKNRIGNHKTYLRPGLVFRTPEISFGKVHDSGLSFQFSPGLTFPLKKNSQLEIDYAPNEPGMWGITKYDRIKNEGGKYKVYKHVSGAAAIRFEWFELAAGYTWSDMDPFGASRNMYVEGEKLEFEKVKHVHSFFLRVGFFLK